MLEQLALLANLRIDDHPPELERNLVEQWLTGFVRKLKRTSSRSQKCRLISAVERTQFRNDANAFYWQYCGFVGDKGMIFNRNKRQIEDFEMTEVQKKILALEPNLLNQYISRWKIQEESGEWILPNELEQNLISEGGEALVFSEKFGNLETAVRVQVFDPFLFTNGFGVNSFSWRINLSEGKD